MKKLEVKLENCYGIKSLEYKFDFEKSNVYSIYAPNGTMKTSFLKTFKQLEIGKEPEDILYNRKPFNRKTNYSILVDGNKIDSNQIFTIESLDTSYKATNLKDLLINPELKEKLDKVFTKRDDFLNYLNNKSGKIGIDFIENKLNEICGTDGKGFLNILENIETILSTIERDYSDYEENYSVIEYKEIDFLDEKIRSPIFQGNIKDFIDKSNEIYENDGKKFLSKNGKFGLNRLKKVQKSLNDENFFFNNSNGIVINGEIFTKPILQNNIEHLEGKLKATTEFKKIDTILGTIGGNKIKELLENNIFLLEDFKDLDGFYKKLLFSYIIAGIDVFKDLKEDFELLKSDIESVSIDDTLWDNVFNEFTERFYVPFKMEIKNKKSVILGENIPKIIFKFCDKIDKCSCLDNEWVEINEDDNDIKRILSKGEERALYLLNVLFEVENKKRLINEGKIGKQLLIIDDIADSFDYKNKYAIIQYLKDLSDWKCKDGNKGFNLIILTHNFDFYRILQTRILGKKMIKKCLIVIKGENGINLETIEKMGIINPFKDWKDTFHKSGNISKVLGLIPFMRNLLEYSGENNDSGGVKKYDILTSLLHIKPDTFNIKMRDLEFIMKEVLVEKNGNTLDVYITDEDNKVYGFIEEASKKINKSGNSIMLQDKIVLAIYIRLKAEKYMISKISTKISGIKIEIKTSQPDGTKITEEKDISGKDFILRIKSNQTIVLYDKYCELFENCPNILILSDVVLMTPENIHLNSFMYEPILDMSDNHLRDLYKKVQLL